MANATSRSNPGKHEGEMEEVEELSKNDLVQEETPQNQTIQEEEGCSALYRGIYARPVN